MRVAANTLATLLAVIVGLLSEPIAAALDPAAGRLLVASRELRDPNFARSVVLIVVHDTEGSIGVVLNRPTGLAAADILPEVSGLESRQEPFYLGGPVAIDAVIVVLRAAETPPQSEHLFSDVFASASPELVRSLSGLDAHSFRLYLGHAGWAPGQLAHEIARGDWHVLPARRDAVFVNEPEALWQRLVPPEGPLSVQRALPPPRARLTERSLGYASSPPIASTASIRASKSARRLR